VTEAIRPDSNRLALSAREEEAGDCSFEREAQKGCPDGRSEAADGSGSWESRSVLACMRASARSWTASARGIAVSIGKRVASTAAQSEVRVSQTVKDLVAGSGLAFRDQWGTRMSSSIFKNSSGATCGRLIGARRPKTLESLSTRPVCGIAFLRQSLLVRDSLRRLTTKREPRRGL
jgi:hypothetical protein